MTRILSTKKLASNQKQFLLNAGFSVIDADFISVEPKVFEIENISDNIIVTSQNGVKALLENPEWRSLKSKSFFCIGAKTALMMKLNGLKVIDDKPYAKLLADFIVENHFNEKFSIMCGNLRRDEIPNILKENNIQLNEIEIYETKLLSQKIKADLNAILFFSPSAVESFLKENTIGNAICFCIGTTTASALEGISENIVIANEQTIENTIIQAIKYFGNNSNKN